MAMSTIPVTIEPTATLDSFRLDGRVAVVTGASSGLGVRFAQVLHTAGATVVLAARRKERLSEIERYLAERVLAISCDVTQEDACVNLVETVIDSLGHIDILVNNAGIGHASPAEDEPMERFRSIIDVNLMAT